MAGKVYDLTLPLRPEHPPWPGDQPFVREMSSSIQGGDECNVSRLTMSSHFGTHLDAPLHFEAEGRTLERLSLSILIGPALVWEAKPNEHIQPSDLPDLSGVERILFKTPNCHWLGDTEFHENYTAVSPDAAKALTNAGVKLVGIDYFSIEAYKSPGHPVHHELCGNGVIIVEGLDLRDVPPGTYELICLPLKIEGGDGGPCRAVLREM